MKIFYTTILVLLVIKTSLSQTIDDTFNKVKTYYISHNVPKNSDIHLNKAAKIIEIGGTNIPLLETTILYNLIQNDNAVTFHCDDGCITYVDKNGNNERDRGFGIVFKTKDECYDFINLIADLTDKLKK